MRRGLQHIIFAFIWIAIGPAPLCDAAGLALDYSIGFNGRFKLNSWTPLSVVLDNRGRATQADLEVIVTSGSEYRGDIYRRTYKTAVDLPQNSKKRYAFTIAIQSFTHDLIIRLRQDQDIIITRSINLRPHFTEKNFAVVADNFVVPHILAELPNHLHPAQVRPKFLPETWYGYDSVALLILRADTIRRLRDRQFQALAHWIKQGGYLVVGTGLNIGALSGKRLQEILPIDTGGHQQLLELKSLGSFCSRELSGMDPFLVLDARIDDSKILVKENDIPIITQKNFGWGQIIFLSFDMNTPPFSRWDGRRLFWEKILSLQPKFDRPMIEVDDQQILNSMLAGLPLTTPEYRSVIIFVGAYLIFLWLILKKIKRPGPARWRYGLALILMVMLFTAFGYWGFYYPNLKQKFVYNSFCQIELVDTQPPATAKYFIGLYSLIKLGYELNFGSDSYPVSHIISAKSNAKIPNPFVLQEKDSGQHIIGSIRRWSHNFYKLNLPVSTPLAGYARHDKSLLTLTVENKLPHNLVDCLLYYRKRFLFVENIPAGNRQTINLDWEKLKKKEIFGEHEVDPIMMRFNGNGSAVHLRKTQRYLISGLLTKIHDKYESQPDSMILLGWLPDGFIQPQFSPTLPAGTGITMISWEIPVEITL